MWLDPYIHVGPASLAAFVASIWYLNKCLHSISANKPDGTVFAMCLTIFLIGIGTAILIRMGHSDSYNVDRTDYNQLVGITLPLVTLVTFWCIQRGWVRPIEPRKNLSPEVGFAGLFLFSVGAHATAMWEFPLSPNRGEPTNAWGHYGSFLIGGVHGIGMFAAVGCLEVLLAVAALNYPLRYFGFANGPRPTPKTQAEN